MPVLLRYRSVRTAEGETAEEAARHNGNKEVADLIRTWGTGGQLQAAPKSPSRRKRNGKSHEAADITQSHRSDTGGNTSNKSAQRGHPKTHTISKAGVGPTWAELANEQAYTLKEPHDPQMRRITVQARMQYSATAAKGTVRVPLKC